MNSSCSSSLRRRSATGLTLATALGLAACAAPPPRVVTPPPPPVEAQPAPPPVVAQPAPPVAPERPARVTLTDGQVVGIVTVADNIDIRLAELALRKSTNRQVRSFATEMVRDHTSLNNAIGSLTRRLRIRPAQSSVTRELIGSANQVGGQLAQLRGAAFDRAYINNEVSYHQQVIQATNQVLIPSARHPQLRAALTNARPIFVEHLRRAQRIMTSLGR